MNRRHFIRLSVSGATALTLTACASDPVPRDMFYRLGDLTPPAAVPGGPIAGTIEVPPFRAEGIVNERAILYREGPRALSQYSFHTWSEPPAVMMQQAFLGALRQSQAFATVASPDMRQNRDFELTGNILELDHVIAGASGTATVAIEVSLRRVRDNKLLITKTYRGEAPAPVDDIDATVAAFTKAMESVLAAFMADLAGVPKVA